MRFAGWRLTITAPTHGNTSARTAFNAEGDDSKPLMLGYVCAAMPRAGTASPIDAPTESQAMRLPGRKLTLALDDDSRTLNWATGTAGRHACIVAHRGAEVEQVSRRPGVWLSSPSRGGNPSAVLEDHQVAGEVVRWSDWLRARKGERAGCQASPLRSPYHDQWKRRRTPTVRRDCRSLPA